MVFTTTNLFKAIACPYGEQCRLTNCIFNHDLRPQQVEGGDRLSKDPIHSRQQQQHSNSADKPDTKRRKVTYENAADKPPTRAEQIRAELAAVRSRSEKAPAAHSPSPSGKDNASDSHPQSMRPPPSLTKSVSPPPTNGKLTSRSSIAGANNSRADNNSEHISNAAFSQTSVPPKLEPEVKEALNPRLIANDPAGHAKRSLYLEYLHGEIARLNRMVSESQSLEHKNLLFLSENEVNKLALDEEEKVAKDQPMVYANIIKNRIGYYRKMKLEEWVTHVKTTFDKDKPNLTNKDAKPIDTGLAAEEEFLLLPHLVADQNGLEKYGYIPNPPTEAEAAEAAAAVEASNNYEICDRCSARFQVFPERNEEGLLTSNGPCKHHPNKKMYPQKTKGDFGSGLPREPYYPCCNAVVGSSGCTELDFHVFKSSSPGRMAAVLPFATTPENAEPAKDKHGREVKAVTFDCEMGYTVYGLELIRLTAVSWPSGKELLDVLVRPVGAIIDLNSRFSGVWPKHFAAAISYDAWQTELKASSTKLTTAPHVADTLPIVDSPQKARELLCSFLTPQTPLIGHAIDNDLNTVRLCHPTIVDTVLLFAHPRGLPMRFGLKMLSSRHLGRNIQTGGDRGHDSLEDAQATGDLVRFKIGEKWKLMSASGWRILQGQLIPPPPPPSGKDPMAGLREGDEDARVKAMMDKVFNDQKTGTKRRKNRRGDGESTEDEELGLGSGVAAYLERARKLDDGE